MIGEIAALVAAFCWAASAVLYKKVLSKTGYLLANLVRSAFAVLFLLSILPLIPFQSSVVSLNELGLLVFAAVTNLVIGDTFYFMGLRKIGVSRAQPISSSYPLYSMVLAGFVLGEPLTSAVLIGTPLIVIGTVAVSLAGNNNNMKTAGGSSLGGAVASIVAALFWSVGLITYKVALIGSTIDTSYATFIRTASILPFLLGAVVIGGESHQLKKAK